MATPSGRLQFFFLEASDYLERLAIIVGRPTAPDGAELVRLSRALRGAALMAGLAPFAQAAAGLEQLAKGQRDNPSGWTPHHAEIAAQTVAELRRLVNRAADWTDQDTDAAADLARRLATDLGTTPPAVRSEPSVAEDEVKPSVRTFVGREGALIAGTLEHAAQALELGQPTQAAEVVLARLQPLRGLATLPNLSPLPEFLDAIELTIRSVRDETAPPGGPLALRRAAAAVTRLAREIAEAGKAGVDAPEVVLGAVTLLEAFGLEDDVVDIATLFLPGDSNPIVSAGSVIRDAGPDSELELVSLADRLRQAADQLRSPGSTTGTTLYLYALLVQLRPLTVSAPSDRPPLAELLTAITSAIGQGRAGRATAEFGDVLREAAEVVGQAVEARNAVFIGDDLSRIVGRLRQLDGPVSSPSIRPTPPASPVSAEPWEGDVVPIESLAPDAIVVEPLPPGLAGRPKAPAAAPTPAPTGGTSSPTPFEQSFSTYHRLINATPAADLGQPPETLDDVVSISALLLRGRRALERADTVRLDLSQALKRQLPFAEIEPLVSELIDLVPLALEE
jgi:hypothetical protein